MARLCGSVHMHAKTLDASMAGWVAGFLGLPDFVRH